MTNDDLVESLSKAGVVPDSVVRFDQAATPRHVRYIDLLQLKGSGDMLPDAVVESGGRPFAYVVRRDRLGDKPQGESSALARLIRLLACRSDARYLCVVSAGTLEAYPIGLFETEPPAIAPDGIQLTWRSLLSAALPLAAKKKRAKDAWLETLLFSLLVDAAKGTHTAAPNLSIQQVLALVGRALFFRFLVDREIVSQADLGLISSNATCLEDLFRTPAALTDTCRWLDITFNGDLLSLEHKDYNVLIEQIGSDIETVCWHLSNIQYRSLGGQLPLDWGGIMFKHVPVDVLSQVYEDFAHEFVPLLAATTSVHFTPRQIAEIIVDGAFSACQRTDLHNSSVLDPAVGGGVFLVLAFRRLVEEHWKALRRRPTRKEIRKILNTQIKGFDINCDALNIAALSLYLAALELDPSPSPLTDLKFEKLIGSVLHPVQIDHPLSLQHECEDASLGSLSSDVLAYRKGSFDIVMANPPWTGFKDGLATLLNKRLTALLAEDTSSPNSKKQATASRYGSPDIAFLLAATKWAKPGGVLGFIVHARFLFQDATFLLRQQVFKRLRVTGLMNFTALRQDKKLWPTNRAPFALIVGRNEPSQSDESFYFISPRHEPHLADVGQFRVDPTAAIPVPLVSVFTGHAFKSIFKGGLLGFRLINHIQSRSTYTIKEKLRQEHLKLNAGYQVGEAESRTQNSKHLQEFPMADVAMRFGVASDAPKFSLDSVQWARKPAIYEGPLLLFRESPKLERELRGALYCEKSTAFSESFSGLSFNEKPKLSLLVYYLHVISYSDLFLYYQLLTSSKFGVERDATLQSDMEQFPLVDIEEIPSQLREDLSQLSRCLRSGTPNWEQLNRLVSELYDLSPADVQLITDTLNTELPYVEIKKQACAPATPQDVTNFIETFNQLIAPFRDCDQPTAIQVPESSIGGWTYFRVFGKNSSPADMEALSEHDVLSLSAIAGSYWATQLTVQLQDGSKLVGRLNHSRYWTRSQARLLALDWLQQPHSLSNTSQ